MKVSLICIKKIKELEDCKDDLLNRYINYFKIGRIYEFEIEVDNLEIEIEDNGFFSYFDYKKDFAFHKSEIDEHFMTLDEWREQRINKILEDD
jgi:hypothetical protein